MANFLGHEVTQEYGVKSPIYNSFKGYHPGIDLRYSLRQPVEALVSGIVARKGWTPTAGNYIVLRAGDGSEHLDYHFDKHSGFNIGNHVNKGNIIGYAGNTGLSKGVHRHYEVRINEKDINPRDYHKEGKVSNAEQDAEFRRHELIDVGKEVSVPEWKGRKQTIQIITNIRQLHKIINEKDAEIDRLRKGQGLQPRTVEVDDGEIIKLKVK